MIQVLFSSTLYPIPSGCIEATHGANYVYPCVSIISGESLADILLQRN